VTARMGKRIRGSERWHWEAWKSHRLLTICIIVSALIHLLFIFSFGPWWMRLAPRVKPTAVKAISLKIKPRRVPPAPPVKAPPKPKEKVPPVRKPVYTEQELEQKLENIRSETIAEKYVRPKVARVSEVVEKKEKEAVTWVDQEVKELDKEIEQVEEGEVGYSRIIDLTKLSDYQVNRFMQSFGMGVGYGRRRITDLNIRFTTAWLFTPGQIKNYAGRYGRESYREVSKVIAGKEKVVSLSESGDGPPRPYIMPTIEVMRAIIFAEEHYLDSTGVKPDELDKLVFSPVWTYRGPTLEVVRAEKKKLGEGQQAKDTRGTMR
jgi:hypothetical protein